ncbi:MAG: SDR family oxidoreductase [Gemmatimonadaceae bacterium]|nr:SDR family oxidoreductase [Gemmatimonadaceae bacterium]MDQ3243758.1 SDR family oxidoreductase [Gemmatimonadota bacterium]
MKADPFDGTVAVITGASAGIGLEIARQLARRGAFLVLAAREATLLESAASACRQLGARVISVPTDVSKRDHCERLIHAAVAEFGRIDTLVNNAGISMHARFDELSDLEAVDRITGINYLGSVYCTFYALPHLKKSSGRIVAVSSLAGRNGVPTRTIYSATKHAMAGFFDSLRIELREDGISVTVVYPGFVATDIAERAIGPNGQPLGTRPVSNRNVMSAEECARLTLDAAAARRREVVMTGRARIGMLLKAFAPGIVDNIAERAVRRGR